MVVFSGDNKPGSQARLNRSSSLPTVHDEGWVIITIATTDCRNTSIVWIVNPVLNATEIADLMTD